MKSSPILALILALISLSLPACNTSTDQAGGEEQQKIVVTRPLSKDIEITLPFVCQIHSKRHIEVIPLETGYLEPIEIKEGQEVQEKQLLFKIRPILYEAKLEAVRAEVQLAQLRYNNTYNLYLKNVVSEQQVALVKAELSRAKANEKLAENELGFTEIRASFPGIIDRLLKQQGSLIKEGDVLTTLSDNSVMWVYFNVPEARYFEYKRLQSNALKSKAYESTALPGMNKDNSQLLELVDSRIELQLADGNIFSNVEGKKIIPSNIVTVEGQFDNKTGNISFRADFENPERLLRHGQTGTVLVYRTLHNALVIPQRAVSELLDKQYVYVIDKEDVVHKRDIVVKYELDDIFVIEEKVLDKKGLVVSGLDVNDKIVLEGLRQVKDGVKAEDYEFRKPEEVLKDQKNPAQ